VLVPLIEETFKPIGVWFLAGQKITPAQGFGFGVLSGAGFGLFENLGNTSSGGETWALLAATRISTLLLHCFTAGLVGWALASAWSQRRYLRLGVAYAIAILIHGSWNAMAVLSSILSLKGVTNVYIPTTLQQIGTFSTIGIVVLGALVLVLFISFNTVLRRNGSTNTLLPVDEAQPPNLSDKGSPAPGVDNHSQSSSNISTSLPLPPADFQLMPEGDPQNPPREGNPTTTESNP
jgi:hypothetical protein